MVRTPCCDQNGMKKGTWTPEEDRKLVAYVTRYGCWNWRQLPKFAGLKRCGKSCRLRWMNYLRPNVKRGNYSKEEEETIIKLHESLGNRWSAIAAQLPGRTDNEVKNYWHTHLKKRVKHNSSIAEKEDQSTNSNSPNDEDLLIEEPINDNVPESYSALTIPQVLDGSDPLSPGQLSSSSEVSTSTTESTSSTNHGTVTSTNNDHNNLVANSNVGNNDLFEAFSELISDNFWTEPFLADHNSYNSSSDFLTSLVETEFFPPSFDANNLLFTSTTGNFFEENLVGLY